MRCIWGHPISCCVQFNADRVTRFEFRSVGKCDGGPDIRQIPSRPSPGSAVSYGDKFYTEDNCGTKIQAKRLNCVQHSIKYLSAVSNLENDSQNEIICIVGQITATIAFLSEEVIVGFYILEEEEVGLQEGLVGRSDLVVIRVLMKRFPLSDLLVPYGVSRP